MANEIPPSEVSDDRKQVSEIISQAEQSVTDSDCQGIFDRRFSAIMDAFGEACEREGVGLAIAIAIHPAEPNRPLVFIRGHEYDVASLLAQILRSMKAQLYAGLDAEPGGPEGDGA